MFEWIGYAALASVYFYVGWQIGGLITKVRRLEEAVREIGGKHNALVRVLTGADEKPLPDTEVQ